MPFSAPVLCPSRVALPALPVPGPLTFRRSSLPFRCQRPQPSGGQRMPARPGGAGRPPQGGNPAWSWSPPAPARREPEERPGRSSRAGTAQLRPEPAATAGSGLWPSAAPRSPERPALPSRSPERAGPARAGRPQPPRWRPPRPPVPPAGRPALPAPGGGAQPGFQAELTPLAWGPPGQGRGRPGASRAAPPPRGRPGASRPAAPPPRGRSPNQPQGPAPDAARSQ